MFDTYARWARVVLGSDRATVALADGPDQLRLITTQGKKAFETGTRIPVATTMIGRVFRDLKSEICHDMAAAETRDCQRLASNGLTACLDAPIVFNGQCLGVLAICYIDARKATKEALLVLETMARSLASYLVLHDQMQQLSDMAHTDPLTRAFNRRYFQQVSAELFTKRRVSGQPFSLAILDLDHFKRLNDTYGHEFGDDVLRAVVEAMKRAVGPKDHVIRMGGEEFCVLLPGAGEKVALDRAEAIRAEIEGLCLTQGDQVVPVTASIGVFAATDAHDSVRSITIAADQALYAAKSSGRNQVRVAA